MARYADPVKDEIAAFIVAKLEEVTGGTIADAAPQDRFNQDLRLDEIDSLANTELIVEIGEHFGITITDAEASATNTLDDLVELILAKTSS
jgi:acyl carrier protein